MKIAMRIALAAGFAVLVALIVRGGAGSILALLALAGWQALWLVPLHAVPLALDILGWRALIPGGAPLSSLFGIAAVREAINRLLPVANIGGEVVGVRLLALTGVDGGVAAASVIVEVLVTLGSQFLFVAAGVAALVHLAAATALTDSLLWGLACTLPIIAFLAAMLRSGRAVGLLQRLAQKILGPAYLNSGVHQDGAALDVRIRALCRSHGRLATALAWQIAGLVMGCVETWLVLGWLGHPMGFAAALALESLAQAARHFVFMVPAGVGVQEAGLVVVGHVLGLGSDVALALSLAKRMREVLFGVPALVGWQWFEGRRGYLHVRSRSER
jgi:putative membrane protein